MTRSWLFVGFYPFSLFGGFETEAGSNDSVGFMELVFTLKKTLVACLHLMRNEFLKYHKHKNNALGKHAWGRPQILHFPHS